MVRLGIVLAISMAFVCTTASSIASPLVDEVTAQRYGLTRPWFTQIRMDTTQDRVQSVTVTPNWVPQLRDKAPEYLKDEKTGEALVKIDDETHYLGPHGSPSSKLEYDRLIRKWLAPYRPMLLVQTKRGVVHALDADTGETIWVNRIGSPSHPTTAIGASHMHIAVINGTGLYLFERVSGKFLWKRTVQSAPGAGPGLSSTHVFVPTISGILEAYDLDNPRRPVWKYNSGGRAMVQPIVSKGSVSWPTDRGALYVASSDPVKIRFRTETSDEIVSQPAHIPPYLYVGSLDGYLYKVHERNGTIAWTFSTGEPVVNRPLAVDGRIYITAQHGGLYCVMGDLDVAHEVDAADRRAAADRGEEVPKAENPHLAIDAGREIWWSPGIVRLLAITPRHVYGMDKVGRIRIVRTDTGSPVDTLQTHDISLSVINHATDRIFIGTTSGLIQCLHEPELVEALSYVIEDPVVRTAPDAKQHALEDDGGGDDGGGDEGGDPFGGDGGDPFGGDDGADPFGGGDEDADPFGDEDENPFG